MGERGIAISGDRGSELPPLFTALLSCNLNYLLVILGMSRYQQMLIVPWIEAIVFNLRDLDVCMWYVGLSIHTHLYKN